LKDEAEALKDEAMADCRWNQRRRGLKKLFLGLIGYGDFIWLRQKYLLGKGQHNFLRKAPHPPHLSLVTHSTIKVAMVTHPYMARP
jgi:hypothetical protein